MSSFTYDLDQAAANSYVSELMSLDLSPYEVPVYSISFYEQELLFGAIVELCGAKAITMGVSPKHAFSIVSLVANLTLAVFAQDPFKPFVLPVIPAPYGE
jgi:hypothetical protein